MTITVVVPSYRRADDLARCLAALDAQIRAPDEVVVVCRPEDTATLAVVEAHAGGRAALVDRPGQVAALMTGLAAATGDVVAITDDDAAPWPDWLARIERTLAEPGVTGTGGRDVIHRAGVPVPVSSADAVGLVQLHGRVVGNHHRGCDRARDVDVLKGANMAFRRDALLAVGGFDTRLAGAGAQVHNDLAVSLALRRAGARLVYDPDLRVDHHPAQRHDVDARDAFSARAQRDLAHNETLVLLEHLPAPRRVLFAFWALAVGTSAVPGLGQAVRGRMRGDRRAGQRLIASLRGRAAGMRTWLRS